MEKQWREKYRPDMADADEAEEDAEEWNAEDKSEQNIRQNYSL